MLYKQCTKKSQVTGKGYTNRSDANRLAAIKAADTAYANIYRVAAASKKAATSSGNFSPEQLATSAAAQSSTLTGGGGTAPLQQFAKEALKIVGKDKTGALTASDLKNLGVGSVSGGIRDYSDFTDNLVESVIGIEPGYKGQTAACFNDARDIIVNALDSVSKCIPGIVFYSFINY